MGNSWTTNQGDCNVFYTGNSSQICGGKSVFNVFEAQTKDTLPPAGTPTPGPTSSNSMTVSSQTTSSSTSTTSFPVPTTSTAPSWQAVGCYKDLAPNVDRPLATLASRNDTSQTPTNCQAQCLQLGTSYAGVQDGRECWCGNTIQAPMNNTPVAESDCNKHCSGDPTLLCGQGGRIYLYEYIQPVVPWIELRCYGEKNPRILRNQIATPGGWQNNTRQNCISGCHKAGYTYAGLENAGECWCDNQLTGQLASDGTAGWYV